MVFGYATEARGQLILHVKARIGRQNCFLVAITQFLKTKAAEIACDTVLTAGYIGALMMCDRRGSVKGDRVPYSLCAAFPQQTGTTPARVVERLRTDLARGRIETTIEPVERIAEAVGFGDAENMRRAAKLAERRTLKPDAELVAVSVLLHDLGLARGGAADRRFEVVGADAGRAFALSHNMRRPTLAMCAFSRATPTELTPAISEPASPWGRPELF
jgi:hypothetical protein